MSARTRLIHSHPQTFVTTLGICVALGVCDGLYGFPGLVCKLGSCHLGRSLRAGFVPSFGHPWYFCSVPVGPRFVICCACLGMQNFAVRLWRSSNHTGFKLTLAGFVQLHVGPGGFVEAVALRSNQSSIPTCRTTSFWGPWPC